MSAEPVTFLGMVFAAQGVVLPATFTVQSAVVSSNRNGNSPSISFCRLWKLPIASAPLGVPMSTNCESPLFTAVTKLPKPMPKFVPVAIDAELAPITGGGFDTEPF